MTEDYERLRESGQAHEAMTKGYLEFVRSMLEPILRQASNNAFGSYAGDGDGMETLGELLVAAQRAMLTHPVAAQTAYSSLVAEGRKSLTTKEGQELARSLELSPHLERVRRVFEATTLNMLEEGKPGVLPSTWVDLMSTLARTEHLDEVLPKQVEPRRAPYARPVRAPAAEADWPRGDARQVATPGAQRTRRSNWPGRATPERSGSDWPAPGSVAETPTIWPPGARDDRRRRRSASRRGPGGVSPTPRPPEGPENLPSDIARPGGDSAGVDRSVPRAPAGSVDNSLAGLGIEIEDFPWQ